MCSRALCQNGASSNHTAWESLPPEGGGPIRHFAFWEEGEPKPLPVIVTGVEEPSMGIRAGATERSFNLGC